MELKSINGKDFINSTIDIFGKVEIYKIKENYTKEELLEKFVQVMIMQYPKTDEKLIEQLQSKKRYRNSNRIYCSQ